MSSRILWSCHVSHKLEIIAAAKNQFIAETTTDMQIFDCNASCYHNGDKFVYHFSSNYYDPTAFESCIGLTFTWCDCEKSCHCSWLLWASRWTTFTYQCAPHGFCLRPHRRNTNFGAVTDVESSSDPNLRTKRAVYSTQTFKENKPFLTNNKTKHKQNTNKTQTKHTKTNKQTSKQTNKQTTKHKHQKHHKQHKPRPKQLQQLQETQQPLQPQQPQPHRTLPWRNSKFQRNTFNFSFSSTATTWRRECLTSTVHVMKTVGTRWHRKVGGMEGEEMEKPLFASIENITKKKRFHEQEFLAIYRPWSSQTIGIISRSFAIKSPAVHFSVVGDAPWSNHNLTGSVLLQICTTRVSKWDETEESLGARFLSVQNQIYPCEVSRHHEMSI